MSYTFKSNTPYMSYHRRQIRSGAKFCLLCIMLNNGVLVSQSALAQQTIPSKPPQNQGTKKPDVPGSPLKPVQGLFGASRTGAVGPLAVPIGPKLSAEEWEKKGREALAARKIEDAIVAFTEVTKAKPSYPGGWFALGAAYEAKRQWSDAANAFKILTGLTPTSGQSYALLSNALLQANQNEAALRALDRAIELNPNASELLIQQGGVYLQQKDARRAERSFLQALGNTPDNPAAHAGMGDAYAQSNRQSAALEEYDAALRIDATYLPARLGRATALAANGRLRQAEEQLAQLSHELEIRDLQLKAKLAGPSSDPRATAQLQAQIAQMPTLQANVLLTLAQMLDTPQRRDDAIKAYQAALKLTPDSATTWGNLGWTQYEAGQYELAIQNSRKALELDSSLAYVRLNLGLLYAVQNNWSEAQKEYRQAIAVSTSTDLEAGIKDVRDAQSKPAAAAALQKAVIFLNNALEKAVLTQAGNGTP